MLQPSGRIQVSKIVDLSHVVASGQTTYPGLPAITLSDHLSHEGSRGRYAEGVTFQISAVQMVANTGTAMDTPFHRFPDKQDVASFPLSRSCDLPAILVRVAGTPGRAVDAADLAPWMSNAGGKAVLIETGWSARWGRTDYFERHPHISAEGATLLRDAGAVLVGIDSLNIDDTTDPKRPAHTILLGGDVAIVENLTELHRLPPAGARFSAAPLRFVGMGACPVRAWATIES